MSCSLVQKSFNQQCFLADNLIAKLIQRDVHSAYSNFSRNLLASCNINPALLLTPLSFKTPIYGEDTLNFTNFSAPGIILA